MTLMLKSRKGHSLMIGSTRDLDKSAVLCEAGVSAVCACVRCGSSSICGGALKRTVGGLVKMDTISLASIDRGHYDAVWTWMSMVVNKLRKHGVLVHCTYGAECSAVAMALLVSYLTGESVELAISYVRRLRVIADACMWNSAVLRLVAEG